MKNFPTFVVGVGLTMPTFAYLHAAQQPFIDLRSDTPQCRTPKAKLPRLGVDFANDMPTEIRDDLNGDGSCDCVLALPYPSNSKMNSYDLTK